MKHLLTFVIILFLVGCSNSPSEVDIQTAIAQTEISKPTQTSTFTQLPTFTKTTTSTATIIPTKTITNTPKPTNTLVPGIFESPAPIGMKVQRDTGTNLKEGHNITMAATVLQVKRGNEAYLLAKQDLELYDFDKPIENQEYLAVQIEFDLIKAYMNEPFSLYRGWQVALRFNKNDDLIWPVNKLLYSDTPIEKYPPFTGTTWVYFLVKEDSHPMLYFQPMLWIAYSVGVETKSGAYFSLE